MGLLVRGVKSIRRGKVEQRDTIPQWLCVGGYGAKSYPYLGGKKIQTYLHVLHPVLT